MLRGWWIVCLLLASQVAYAQSELEEVLRFALQRSPRVQQLQREVQSAQWLRRGAQLWQSPTILVSPAITSGGVGEEVLIHQPLEVNGARFRRAQTAQAEYQLALAEAAQQLNQLLAEVASAYYQYVYAQRLAELAQQALQLAEQTREKVRLQVESGVRPGVDLLQVEIDLERVRSVALQRQAEAETTRHTLQALLGGELPLSLREGQATLVLSDLLPDDITSGASAPAEPLSLRVERARLRLEERLLTQIRTESVPDLGVQARVERLEGERTRPGFGLTISLPFLEYGSLRARQRSQQARLRAQELRLRATELETAAALQNAQRMVLQAKARVQSYREHLLPRARQLAQSAQVGLESGHLGILQVLEAQRTLRSVEEEALQAELEARLNAVHLWSLQGRFLREEVLQ